MAKKTATQHKRHPVAIARDQFESENPATFEVTTLSAFRCHSYDLRSEHLRNRLHRAFQAGWDAAIKAATAVEIASPEELDE